MKKIDKKNMERILLNTKDVSVEKKTETSQWFNQLNRNLIGNITNLNLFVESIEIAKTLNKPVPFIITLCPAVFNLTFPTSKGQTRELVAVEEDNTRMTSLFEELFGLQIFFKQRVGVDTEFFVLFADLLEKGAERMIVNTSDIENVSTKSIQSIKEILRSINTSHGTLFQQIQIKTPKIRLQSNIAQQGGKINLDRNMLIHKTELDILNPESELFELWTKHVRLAKRDAKFTVTSWQGVNSAEAIWSRMRFLIAELVADGIFLPEIFKKVSSNTDIEPVFLASSTRPATLEMESDCFSLQQKRVLLPAFRNVGKWLSEPEESPWINILRNV